jgi:hypothetical protein
MFSVELKATLLMVLAFLSAFSGSAVPSGLPVDETQAELGLGDTQALFCADVV